jgi:hypothetical protein
MLSNKLFFQTETLHHSQFSAAYLYLTPPENLISSPE